MIISKKPTQSPLSILKPIDNQTKIGKIVNLYAPAMDCFIRNHLISDDVKSKNIINILIEALNRCVKTP